MTELQKKMIRALELRNLSKHSKKAYLNGIRDVVANRVLAICRSRTATSIRAILSSESIFL